MQHSTCWSSLCCSGSRPIGAFVVSGLLGAIAGVVLAARLRIGQASVGLEFLLPALVGAFLGSTTIRPGRVNVWGTVVGVAILAAGISGIQQFGGQFYVEPLKQCGQSKVLEFVDTPLAEASSRMPQLTTSLLQRYGASWTHSLSINDLTFDFMAPSLEAAGINGDGKPLNISAGDGSEAAFQRIRQKEYQEATVAEPLRLQGWQAVDEANRALSKQKDSGFVAPPHLFTDANIGADGGPRNVYDPENQYADIYKKIWAGK